MQVLVTSYEIPLVALSFLLAVVGSFISLYAARRIIRRDGTVDGIDLLIASISLGGVGVWSMHFVGMLALNIPVAHGYSMLETIVSAIAAVGGTAAALVVVARKPGDLRRMAAAGTLLGLGVCVMHYLGMYGMRFGGVFDWSFALLALSVLIAIVAATAALWLAFNIRTINGTFMAAVVMGVAVCAMHYTGMAAADFVCYTNKPASSLGGGILTPADLSSAVIVAIIGIAAVLGADQAYHALSRKTATR
ncbi:MAG: MHYT domain-containing protein [Pseudomonadota bacterium]